MRIASIFFCSILSINGAAIYLLLRTGFSIDYFSVFKVLGLVLILLILPSLIEKRLNKDNRERWFYNDSFQLLMLLIFFSLIGFAFKQYSFDPAPIVTALGYVLFIWLLGEFFKTNSIKKVFLYFTSAIIFSIFIISIILSLHIEPLFYEDLYSGAYHMSIDTLYHIANAQMLNTYNTLSTGLDGVTYMPYHYGSHVLYTELANFLRIRLLDAYVLLPIIFLGPLFMYTFFHLIGQIKKLNGISNTIGFAFILILLTAFIGFMRNTNYQFGGDIPDYAGMLLGSPILFLSDSYTLSLIFLNIIFALSINFYCDYTQGLLNKTNTLIFLWGVLPIAIFFAGFSKISSLYSSFILVSYLFIRLKLFSNKYFTVSYLIIIIISVAVFQLVRDQKFGDGNLSLFYHFKQTNQNVFIFLVFNFIWFWALLFLFIAHGMIKSKEEILVPPKLLGLEIILVLIMASLIPAFLIEIRGGNLYYFTEIPSWYSVVLILAYLPLFNFDKFKRFRRYVMLNRALMGIIFIYLTNVFYKNIQSYAKWMLMTNYSARYYMLKGPVGLLEPRNFKIKALMGLDKESFSAVKEPLNSVHFDVDRVKPIMNFLNKLCVLNELPLSEKKQSLIYINFSDIEINLPVRCYEKPFLIPALSGMASIYGGVTEQCLQENPWFRGYGYEYYKPSDSTTIDVNSLKLAIIQKGFKWLYYYDNNTKEFIKMDANPSSKSLINSSKLFIPNFSGSQL